MFLAQPVRFNNIHLTPHVNKWYKDTLVIPHNAIKMELIDLYKIARSFEVYRNKVRTPGGTDTTTSESGVEEQRKLEAVFRGSKKHSCLSLRLKTCGRCVCSFAPHSFGRKISQGFTRGLIWCRNSFNCFWIWTKNW